MATKKFTPNLGLIVSSDLTPDAKSNLYKIDEIAEVFKRLNSASINIEADNDINILPADDLNFGSSSSPVDVITAFSSSFVLSGTTTITGLVYNYSELNFDGSLTAIPDYNIVISANPDVAASTSHRNSSSSVHGVTGSVVGTSDSQALTNKLIDATTNTLSNISNASIKAGAGIVYSKLTLTGSIVRNDLATAVTSELDGYGSHVVNTNNPHSVTAAQVGTYTSDEIDTLVADLGGGKLYVSSTDTVPDYLEGKLAAGTGVSLVKTDDPGDALLTINNTDTGSSALSSHLSAFAHGDIAHSNRTALDAVSGTNTGDETNSSIKTKLGAATSGSDGYLTSADWSAFDGKQAALGFTPVNKAGDTMTGLLTLDNLGLKMDITGDSPVSPTTGQIFWDKVNETLAIKMAGTDVVQQVGQELFVRALNDTASTILNGEVVYISGASSGVPTIALARADVGATSDGVIGIATEDIPSGAQGYVTTMGKVNDIKTDVDSEGNALSVGDSLYLSPSVAGGYTKTLYMAPYHQAQIGHVLKVGATDGTILTRIEIGQHLDELHDVLISGLSDRDVFEYDSTLGVWKNFLNPSSITKEPTGFADPAGIVINYDSSTRKATITHSSGTIVYYNNGIRYTRDSGYETEAHADVVGSYYFAFATGNVPTWSASFPGFDDGTFAIYVYYGASNKFALRECHGLMPWQAWKEFHQTIGTYLTSGGTVPGASWAANTDTIAAVTPVIAEAVINDEDLPTTVLAGVDGNTYTRVHISNGSAVFTTGSTFPYPVAGAVGTGNPQYNLNPTSGTALVDITSQNRWFNIYGILVPTTADSGSQEYRHLWLTGQTIYTSLALAQAEDFRGVNLGDLTTIFPEMVPYVRVSYRRDSGYDNTYSTRMETGCITYLAGSRSSLVSVSGFVPTIHNTLTGRDVADAHPADAISSVTTGFVAAGGVSSILSAADTDVLAALNTLARGVSSRYSAALSWAGAGPYTMTITGATHLRGTEPIVRVRELTGGTTYEVVDADKIEIDGTTGDVTITSTSNFTGSVVIL
jgi:hypothetical protein